MRCCFNNLAKPAQREFARAFSRDNECLFIVISPSRHRDGKATDLLPAIAEPSAFLPLLPVAVTSVRLETEPKSVAEGAKKLGIIASKIPIHRSSSRHAWREVPKASADLGTS